MFTRLFVLECSTMFNNVLFVLECWSGTCCDLGAPTWGPLRPGIQAPVLHQQVANTSSKYFSNFFHGSSRFSWDTFGTIDKLFLARVVPGFPSGRCGLIQSVCKKSTFFPVVVVLQARLCVVVVVVQKRRMLWQSPSCAPSPLPPGGKRASPGFPSVTGIGGISLKCRECSLPDLTKVQTYNITKTETKVQKAFKALAHFRTSQKTKPIADYLF